MSEAPTEPKEISVWSLQAEGPGRGASARREKLLLTSRSPFLPSIAAPSLSSSLDIRQCDKGAEGACWLELGSVLEADSGGALNHRQAAAQFTASLAPLVLTPGHVTSHFVLFHRCLRIAALVFLLSLPSVFPFTHGFPDGSVCAPPTTTTTNNPPGCTRAVS